MGSNPFVFKTEVDGSLLHFAVECASQLKPVGDVHRDTAACLRQLLKVMKLDIERADVNG